MMLAVERIQKSFAQVRYRQFLSASAKIVATRT
jgi:hypothetical protein